MRAGLWLTLVVFALCSCIDEKDYTINSAEVSPSMDVPLVFGNLTIGDLLKNSDSLYVKVYPDDVVYLGYSSLLVTNDVRNRFSIPDKGITQSFSIPQGTIPPHSSDISQSTINEVVDLGLSPEKLSEIDFKSGTITYSATLLPNTSNLEYEVIFSSPDFTSKTTGNTLAVSTSNSGSLSLADYKAVLNDNRFDLKMVLILKKTTSSRTIGHNTSVAVNFSMAGMNFNYIKGFLGDRVVQSPSGSLTLDAFGNTLHDASVSFPLTQVTMDVVNDYGVSAKLDFFKLEARKGGAILPIQLNPASPVPVAFPTTLGTSAQTHITITNSRQVMDFAPNEIFYQFNTHLNQGLTTGNNFLADTSRLRVRLNVEVPLVGRGSGIVLRDTTNIDLGKANQSQIKRASLRVNVINEMPLDAKMQLYLADNNGVIIDSLLDNTQTALVKGSTVTAAGDLEVAGELTKILELDADKVSKLFTSQKLIIKAIMSTSKDALGNTVDVKFKSKQTLIVNVGLSADLNFNVKF